MQDELVKPEIDQSNPIKRDWATTLREVILMISFTCLEIQVIADDVTSMYVPPHVSILNVYCWCLLSSIIFISMCRT